MKTFAKKSLNIAILGAGAMGSLFGGYLGRGNNVLLIDVSESLVKKINTDGLVITEIDGSASKYPLLAVTNVDNPSLPKADIVIVFVKAMHSREAIKSILPIITADTYLMSLQNGVGHEDVLREFVDQKHILIGTTQHNCTVLSLGIVKHGGSGMTHIGCVSGDVEEFVGLAKNFTSCGIKADISDNYKKLVWEKLFTNVSASALTGVLQVPLGFIVQNKYTWDICQELIREAVLVAKNDGVEFDACAEIDKVKTVCENSPKGITSICTDLCNGRKTEVDTISGGIVRFSKKFGVSTPYHEIIVKLIHSLEEKNLKYNGREVVNERV